MKRILLYILPFFMLVGCGRHSVDSRLAQVNELANRNETDSAMMVLSSIEKQSLNEHNRHYYDLMSIKTRDKAYQDVTGDTVITDIIDYFDGNGSDYEKGEAYYYGGRVYREMGGAPQALDYFQKAQDVFPEDEAMMKGKTASQMGQLFLELYMFEHAKPKFQEAIRYQKDCKDSVGQILNLRVLGDVYRKLDMNDSSLYSFKQALYLNSKSESHLKREVDIRSSIIDLYISQSEYDKAREEFEKFEELSNTFDYDYVLCTKINMYIVNKNYTKAINIAHQLKQSQSLRSRIFAYSVLLDYSKMLNNNKSVYHYAIEHNKCVDSLNLQASANAVINQNSFYNYSIREKRLFLIENKQLRTQILLLLTLVVILIFSYFYVKIRKQNIFLQDSNEKLTISNDKLSDELSERLHRVECLEKEVSNLNNRIVDEYSAISRLGEQVRNGILEKNARSYDKRNYSKRKYIIFRYL